MGPILCEEATVSISRPRTESGSVTGSTDNRIPIECRRSRPWTEPGSVTGSTDKRIPFECRRNITIRNNRVGAIAAYQQRQDDRPDHQRDRDGQPTHPPDTGDLAVSIWVREPSDVVRNLDIIGKLRQILVSLGGVLNRFPSGAMFK
jgi:hypothetical protein